MFLFQPVRTHPGRSAPGLRPPCCGSVSVSRGSDQQSVSWAAAPRGWWGGPGLSQPFPELAELRSWLQCGDVRIHRPHQLGSETCWIHEPAWLPSPNHTAFPPQAQRRRAFALTAGSPVELTGSSVLLPLEVSLRQTPHVADDPESFLSNRTEPLLSLPSIEPHE